MARQDRDQAAVYAAEQDVRLGLEQMNRLSMDTTGIEFLGSYFEPETEPRFGAPTEVGVYLERVRDHLERTGADFGGREVALPRVRLRRGHRAAHYEADTETIAIPDDTGVGGWALRGMVVWHELAHHLALRPDAAAAEPDHGADFRSAFLRLLEALGMTQIAGMLLRSYEGRGLSVVGYSVDDRTLETMRRLLAQAESTDSAAERDTCMDRVQRLATRHQVALAVLRAKTVDQEHAASPVEESIQIGEPGQRSLWCFVNLMTAIMHSNSLLGTVAHGNTSMTLLGFREDIDIAKQLFYSLSRQMQAAWKQYLAEFPAEYAYTGRPESRPKKVATITRKNAFFTEFGNQVARRLAAAREAAIQDEKLKAADRVAEQTADSGYPDYPDNLAVGSATDPDVAPLSTGTEQVRAATSVDVALRDREVAVTDAFQEMVRRRSVRGHWRHPEDASCRAPSTALAGMDAAERASLGGERELDQ